MICMGCGKEGKTAYCSRCFLREFQAGFDEADEEIRNSNPHIYGNTERMWTSGNKSFWEDVRRASRETFADYASKQQKPPWPRPQITVISQGGYVNFEVRDPVTEGWVLVPLEMLEAKLGRTITRPAQTSGLHRADIEDCARRLLILLVYGCPPKLNAPPPEKPEVDPSQYKTNTSDYFFFDSGKFTQRGFNYYGIFLD
jgi:hypothetical protein